MSACWSFSISPPFPGCRLLPFIRLCHHCYGKWDLLQWSCRSTSLRFWPSYSPVTLYASYYQSRDHRNDDITQILVAQESVGSAGFAWKRRAFASCPAETDSKTPCEQHHAVLTFCGSSSPSRTRLLKVMPFWLMKCQGQRLFSVNRNAKKVSKVHSG